MSTYRPGPVQLQQQIYCMYLCCMIHMWNEERERGNLGRPERPECRQCRQMAGSLVAHLRGSEERLVLIFGLLDTPSLAELEHEPPQSKPMVQICIQRGVYSVASLCATIGMHFSRTQVQGSTSIVISWPIHCVLMVGDWRTAQLFRDMFFSSGSTMIW